MSSPNLFTIHQTCTQTIDTLREAANAAFAQYLVPVHFTPVSYADFCRNYSIDLTHSLLAQDQAGKIVGVALLGIRGSRGWCGGLAVVPERRGQGVGRALIDGLIETARTIGLKTLQLECLTENASALRLYQRAGFMPTREVDILSGAFADVVAQLPSATPGIVISPCAPIDAFSIISALSAPAPVWQREPVSLLSQGDYQGYAAFANGRIQAVLLTYLNAAQSVLSIGAFAFSDEDAGRALLAHAWAAQDVSIEGRFTLSNEPTTASVVPMLISMGFVVKMRQREMLLTLSPQSDKWKPIAT